MIHCCNMRKFSSTEFSEKLESATLIIRGSSGIQKGCDILVDVITIMFLIFKMEGRSSRAMHAKKKYCHVSVYTYPIYSSFSDLN